MKIYSVGRLQAISFVLAFACASAGFSQEFPNGYAVANWKDEAKASLLNYSTGSSVTESDLASHPTSVRCIKMNNYWCIKDVGWKGRLGHDKAGHTVFSEAVWSARAGARDLKNKYRRGLMSAILIANAYLPWTDTIGSRPYKPGEKRCTKPNNIADASHCRKQPHCNCPPTYAKAMLKGTNQTISDDLGFVNNAGELIAAKISPILRNMSRIETGWTIATEELVLEGIELEKD